MNDIKTTKFYKLWYSITGDKLFIASMRNVIFLENFSNIYKYRV